MPDYDRQYYCRVCGMTAKPCMHTRATAPYGADPSLRPYVGSVQNTPDELATLRARVAELEQELAAANGEPHADRCAQSRRLKVMCVEREKLLLEAAAMMLAGAALMPDEMLFRWKGMRGMVERIGELSIQRAAIDAAMKGGA